MDHLKNIIGTFMQPKAVFINTNFLKTLPQRQLVSGFAEMLKHGLIADRDYFYQLKTASPLQMDTAFIRHSVNIKNDVVMQDPEENGLRKILNFGHTIGHAVESYSLQHDHDPLLHGEAIAVGMICEAYLSAQKNSLPAEDLDEVVKTFKQFFQKYSIKEASVPALLEIMKSDKKNTSGQINCSLLTQIGHCAIDCFLYRSRTLRKSDILYKLLTCLV